MQNFRKDGVAGLQRGLSLGITREICFNAVRIGLLQPMLGGVHSVFMAAGLADAGASPSAAERTAAGLACGALGGCVINPVEVLKTRFQAFGGLTGWPGRSRKSGPFSRSQSSPRFCKS